MKSAFLRSLASSVRRPAFLRRFRKIVRRDDGAVAVEFGFVIIPFIALMFALIEVALIFYAGQVLETAVADSARLIMTGQAQKQGMTQAQFKTEVCNRLYALFDCQSGIKVDVRKWASFDAIDLGPPLNEDGELDTDDFGYDPGIKGEIVVVRVVYEWPTFVRTWMDLADLPNGKRLLIATSAFRNEPYN